MATQAELAPGQIVKVSDLFDLSGEPEVPGFYLANRGRRHAWVLRYRAGDKQRSLEFGHLADPEEHLRDIQARKRALRTMKERKALAALIQQHSNNEVLSFLARGARQPLSVGSAIEWAKRIRQLIDSGLDPVLLKQIDKKEQQEQKQEQHDDSMNALAENWLDYQENVAKRRSVGEVRQLLRTYVLPTLGKRPVGTIRRKDIYALADGLLKAGHVATANKVVRNVKAMLSWAVSRDEIEMNPLLRMKLAVPVQVRERILLRFHPDSGVDRTELDAVWAATTALPEPRATFVRVLLLTAQRRAEVAHMEWIELDGGLWTLPKEKHKGGRGHNTPLAPQVRAMIDSLPRVSPFVFAWRGGRPIGDFSDIMAILQVESGVRDWSLHDLRRTAASWMEESFPRDDVHAVLGHSLGKLTATYMQGPGYVRKRKVLEAWANFVLFGAAQATGVAISEVPDLALQDTSRALADVSAPDPMAPSGASPAP